MPAPLYRLPHADTCPANRATQNAHSPCADDCPRKIEKDLLKAVDAVLREQDAYAETYGSPYSRLRMAREAWKIKRAKAAP